MAAVNGANGSGKIHADPHGSPGCCVRPRERSSWIAWPLAATDLYSTVCAVQNLWLAARAESLGVGWVSILDFDRLRNALAIPAEIVPVAYLCIGYVSEFPGCPELETG